MAIGVSYMGHDGRRADFTTEGNPTPGSALDQLVRGGTGGNPLTPLAEQMRRARRPQAPDPRTDKAAGTVRLSEADRRPGTLTEKMKRGGSVVASENGVCLKGEEQVAGNGVYAKNGEKQGFLTLDEIDNPNAKGGVVGEADSQNRLTPSNKTSSDKEGAFGVNMQSRTEAEVNEETGEVTFWEYTKRWDVTNGRRVGEVGGETKRKICSFFLGGGERQITLTGDRAPFTVVRSHYKDENGETKYEYWVKCLKWGDYVGKDASEYSIAGIVNRNKYHENENVYHGAYPRGVFGHYPQRPSNRPKKIVFDSGREALDEIFEETSTDPAYNDNCNCWTYIGSSDEFPDGNFKLYGYFIEYQVPYKNKDANDTIEDIDLVGYYDQGGWWLSSWHPGITYRALGTHYSFKKYTAMVVTTQPYTKRELLNFLVSNGALVSSANKNDGYDEHYEAGEFYHDGEKIMSVSAINPALETVFRDMGYGTGYNKRYWWSGSGFLNPNYDVNDKYPFASVAQMTRTNDVEGSYSGHSFENFVSAVVDDVFRYEVITPTSVDKYGSTGPEWYRLLGLADRAKNWFKEMEKYVSERVVKFRNYSNDEPRDAAIELLDIEWELLDDDYDQGRISYEEWDRRNDEMWDRYNDIVDNQYPKYSPYNGNWIDFFPFTVINGNSSDGCIAEIKDFEIISSKPTTSNVYFAVTENLKGEIIGILKKMFGSTIRVDDEDIVIADDIVIVEKKK